jgi:hypothetical protein
VSSGLFVDLVVDLKLHIVEEKRDREGWAVL